jgi:hypothetical protein
MTAGAESSEARVGGASASPRTVEADGDDVALLMDRVAPADTLPPGTRLVVFASRPRRWLGKLFASTAPRPSPVIASVLLARGYVAIEAGEESGRPAVWGYAPAA